MSGAAFVLGSIRGFNTIGEAYISVLTKTNRMQVQNAKGPTYPFRTTSVTFVNLADDKADIRIQTVEKCIFREHTRFEEPCYETERTVHPQCFFNIEFLHSCIPATLT